MNLYLESMKRLYAKGLLTPAMIAIAVTLGRITQEEAETLTA